MLYSIAIQAHPSRKAYIPYLLEQLGPDTPIAWDEKSFVWDTWHRAADLRDPAAKFHVMIQDDALIGKNFHARIERMLKEGGDGYLYCLFFRKKARNNPMNVAATNARRRKQNHVILPKFQWAVGSVIPTHFLPDLLEFGDRVGSYGDDPRINTWAKNRGVKTWYPLPSLVNHRIGVSVISEKRPRNRQAWWFV